MNAPQAAPYPLRMPSELRARLSARAQANGRSLNAEIIAILQQATDGSLPQDQNQFADRIAEQVACRLRSNGDMQDQLRVELVGELIVARLRGIPTQALLRQCQERVLALMQESGRCKALYDALELEPPHVDVILSQRSLDLALNGMQLRRAILVPNTKLAYLARLAFGEGDYRVFYNDMSAAIQWLEAP